MRPNPVPWWPPLAICLRVSVTVAALFAVPGAGAADYAPLGRLFMTAEKREALDRQRAQNLQREQVIQSAEVAVNGLVARSDGHRTVWLNGRPFHDTANPGDIVTVPTRDAATVRLRSGDRLDATLKVGQAVDRNSGTMLDPMAGGHISRGKADGR